VILARREERLKEVEEQIRQLGSEATVVVGDVTKAEDHKRAVDTALDTYGALHIAFNNAGQNFYGPIADMEEKDFDAQWTVNAKSMFLGMKYQIPAIRNTAGGKGSIINCSSVMSTVGRNEFEGRGPYSATKAAIEMLTQYAAIENPDIRFNTVNPGLIDTEMTRPEMGEQKLEQKGKEWQVLGRPGKATEIAPMVAFLASDEASFITGTSMLVDGGWHLKA